MIRAVVIFDFIFFFASVFGLVLLFKGWKRALGTDTKLLLSGLLLFAMVYSFCLAVEWSGITTALDTLEDYIGAMIPMWWAFVLYAFSRDISRRDLVDSKEKLRRVIDNIVGSFIYKHDTEGKFIYVSRSVEKVLGYSREDFLRHFTTYLTDHPVNAKVGEYTTLSIAGVQQPSYEIQVFHKDGARYWLEVTEVPVRDESGAVVAVEGIAHDITERKEAEEEHSRLTAILEATSDLVLTSRLDRHLLYMNRAGRALLGWTEDEDVTQRRISDVHPDWANEIIENEGVRTAIEEGLWEGETAIIASDGMDIPVSQVIMSHKSQDGKLEYLSTIMRDISEVKEAEDALRVERDFSNSLINSSPAFFVAIDSEGNIRMMSNSMLDTLGYSNDEVIGKNYMSTFVHGDDREKLSEVFARLVENGVSTVNENYILAKDGRSILVEWHGKPMYTQDGEFDYFFGVGIDITDRKKAEAEREQLLKMLASKNEELESILYVSTHDLKSPIVNIQGFSGELEGLCRELAEDLKKNKTPEIDKRMLAIINEEIPESLGFIRGGSLKIKSLLDGLMKVLRISAKKVNIETLDMNKLLVKVRRNMSYEIKQKNVSLTVKKLPACLGDSDQIDQVFTNLIENALKYLYPNRKGEISITGLVENNVSIYCVEDNGIGISPSHQDKIFELFHRLDPNDGIEGEGLGLTIVSRILQPHNGSIRVESEPGKGSRFYISLPTCPEPVVA